MSSADFFDLEYKYERGLTQNFIPAKSTYMVCYIYVPV